VADDGRLLDRDQGDPGRDPVQGLDDPALQRPAERPVVNRADGRAVGGLLRAGADRH
jgi:hypothetical protein